MNEKDLLNGEIESRINELKGLDLSSKEYADAVDSVTKLMDRLIEIEKFEENASHNEKQMKEDRYARYVKNAIDVGAILLPLGVTIWGTVVSLTFEEKGTITSSVGRKFMDKLISKK